MNLAYQQHFFGLDCAVEYGPNVHEKLGDIVSENQFTEVLLVTDPILAKIGLVEKVSAPMRTQGANIHLFAEIDSEPTDKMVHNGAELMKGKKIDLVVGLGGGSAMDAAKCIAAMAVNPGQISDYESVENKFENKRTQMLVTLPTTSGSGAEIAGWAVITDTARNVKMSIGSELITPDIALVDPVLTLDLPPAQTVYSGFDALSQAIEGMLSRRRTPITIALGLYAVELIAENLPRAYSRGYDLEARSNMAIGSLLAGIVINTSGCIAVHSLAETMGALYHVPHGAVVGRCMPLVLAYNMPGDYELLALIGEKIGAYVSGLNNRDAARETIAFLEQMLDDLNVPTLEELGLKEQDVKTIAELAMGNACLPDNPCDVAVDDFMAMLERGLEAS